MTNNLGTATYTVGGDYDAWGDKFVSDMAIINKAFGDILTLTDTSGTVTLTQSQSNYAAHKFTGSGASLVTVAAIDDIGRLWFVNNARASGSVKYQCADGLGTSVTLAAGDKRFIYSDGTDVIDATLATVAISNVSGLQAALDALQPLDSDLTAIAALTTTSFGRAFLALANAAAARSAIGTVIGADVQAYSANLDEYAAVNPTAAGLALLDDAAASDQRTTLGLVIGADVQAYDAGNKPVAGVNELFIPATAFTRQTTNGAAEGIVELATTLQPLETLDFDTTTQEFAVFPWAPPKRWSLGTVTAQFYWTAASGSGGVAFALEGIAISDDDALNTAYGTEQVATDTLIAANDLHISAATSAITIGGTPADADLVWLRVKRVPANGSDTLAVDAKLIGVKLLFTVDQGNDA